MKLIGNENAVISVLSCFAAAFVARWGWEFGSGNME